MEYKMINGRAEHLLVVEKVIGRSLTKEERVHHLDLNKKNNNIKNLMVFPNDKKHISFHNKIQQFGYTNPVKRQIKNRWNKIMKCENGCKNCKEFIVKYNFCPLKSEYVSSAIKSANVLEDQDDK